MVQLLGARPYRHMSYLGFSIVLGLTNECVEMPSSSRVRLYFLCVRCCVFQKTDLRPGCALTPLALLETTHTPGRNGGRILVALPLERAKAGASRRSGHAEKRQHAFYWTLARRGRLYGTAWGHRIRWARTSPQENTHRTQARRQYTAGERPIRASSLSAN